MPRATNALLWYVSYGSNMSADRFSCYIRGGRPAGATRTYLGARNQHWPIPSTTWTLPGAVHFAGKSRVWEPLGGGVAFYVPGEERSVARGWLLTREQLMDVAAQENGGEAGDFDDRLGSVLEAADARVKVGGGAYDVLLRCGERDSYPGWTFTSSKRTDEMVLNAPSAAYLNVLADGLVETTGWSRAEALAHLSAAPGASAAA